jgi:hypothetical protein
MTLYRVVDAAYPPGTPPPGCQGVLGYIGGSRATNVWTRDQWLPFAHLHQFPAWVPATTDNPVEAGQFAVRAARELGWAPKPSVAGWQRVIVIDLETIEDRAWYAQCAAAITGGGFIPVAYGSLSTVLANAASDVIAADWDGQAVIPPGQTIHGHQDQANVPYDGTQVDYSAIDEWLYDRGGVGPRHA